MTQKNDRLIEGASLFAYAAHTSINQRRKYTNEPYIVHPIEVMESLVEFDLEPEIYAASICHDLIEDTHISYEILVHFFGRRVGDLVQELTNPSIGMTENRKIRKAVDLEHLRKASREAKMIRVADIKSNVRTIYEHDPNFSRVYIPEKIDCMEAMIELDGWKLYDEVYDSLENMKKEMSQQ